MNKVHVSAKPSHYDKEAESYDAFNESNSIPINQLIEKILKAQGAKTVLDLTCGTGSQVFWLAERGYEIIGADINSKMLKIATDKARQRNLPLKFLKGDMRTINVGEFDVVITIFNAVGHLTKSDFEKAMQNVHRNLKADGLYLFDIFNLSYLLEGNNITRLTIDWQEVVDDSKVREIQYSTISNEGILTSYDIYHQQKGTAKPRVSRHSQTLQVYTAKELQDMLKRNGFQIVDQCTIDGSEFDVKKSDRIFTVAKKAR